MKRSQNRRVEIISSSTITKPKKPHAKHYGKPKSPQTAMWLFIQNVNHKYKSQYPKLTKTCVSNKMKEDWYSFTLEQKTDYINMEQQDQKRYDKEMSQWKQTQKYQNYTGVCELYLVQSNIWQTQVKKPLQATKQTNQKPQQKVQRKKRKPKGDSYTPKHIQKYKGMHKKGKKRTRRYLRQIPDCDTSTDDDELPAKKKQRILNTKEIVCSPMHTNTKSKSDQLDAQRCKNSTSKLSELPQDIEMKDITFIINTSYSSSKGIQILAGNKGKKLLSEAYKRDMEVIGECSGLTDDILNYVISWAYHIDIQAESFKPRMWSSAVSKDRNTKNGFVIAATDNLALDSTIRKCCDFNGKVTPSNVIGKKWITRNDSYSVDVDVILEWNSMFGLGICNNKQMRDIRQNIITLDSIDYNMVTSQSGVGMTIDKKRIRMYDSSEAVFEKNISMSNKVNEYQFEGIKATVSMVICGGFMYFEVNGQIVCDEGMELPRTADKFCVVICGLNQQKFQINRNRKLKKK
eukprot:143259_1